MAVTGSVWAAPRGENEKPRKSARPAASVQVLTTSQANMLRFGFARVRVFSRGPGAVRVFLDVDGPGANDEKRVAKGLKRFRRRGRRILKLRLTPAGKRALQSCEQMDLEAEGRSRRRRGRRSARLRPAERRVTRDRKRCTRSGRPVSPLGGGGSGGGSAGGGSGGSAGGGSFGPGGGTGGGPPRPLGPVNTENDTRCDFLDPSVCLYPWPNDHFTVADASTDTKRKLALNELSMPRNKPTGNVPEGKPIEPTDQNRADGFSPGNKIITKVPGLDNQTALERTGAVPIWDMAQSFDPDQPVVVINARTKERHLIWAEVDANPDNVADRTLIIRPGTNFDEGQRYIVALRNLRDKDGNILQPREEFRAYRDKLAPQPANPALEARRPHFENDIFKPLADAGIERDNLYLAWDFTVASEKSLTGRMLTMRDDAFAQPFPAGLGDPNLADKVVQPGSSAPAIVPNSLDVTNFTEAEDSRIARRVEGKILVPCYLAPNCEPGSRFPAGAPVRSGFHTASFRCHIPHEALKDNTPDTRVSLYGHGLLGSRGELNQGQLKDFGKEQNIMFCATDWIGMACADLEFPDADTPQNTIAPILADLAAGQVPNTPITPNCDLPNILAILQDVSLFPTLADRVQQGMLNFLYLGRLMIHPAGLSALPAFTKEGTAAGTPILDTKELFYDGNSQGGIIGGSLAAVGVDHTRAVLGVPGMNYSTLLRRSVDFDSYAEGNFEGVETAAGLYDNYPNELERPLIISLMQLLWDRAEANGYAHHMTSDPLPNTPVHQVMLHVGFGDHQVADVTTEVEARTIGARVHRPVLDTDRPRYRGRPPSEKSLSFFGLPSAFDGFTGSALVFWDIGPRWNATCTNKNPPNCDGLPPPHPQNLPPREGEDPHEFPRRAMNGRLQKSEFFKGTFMDTCGGKPCYAKNWTGPAP